MPKFSPLTKLLAAVAAVAVPYLIWTAPESGPSAAVSTSDAALAAELLQPPAGELPPAPTSLPPLSAFEATVERPLFVPTRRLERPEADGEPVAPEIAAVDPEAVTDEPAIRLLGTLRRDAQMVALVSLDDGERMEQLRLGAVVGDWRVVAIERNSLTLDLDGERRDYTLFSSFEAPDGLASFVTPAPAAPDADEDPEASDEEMGVGSEESYEVE